MTPKTLSKGSNLKSDGDRPMRLFADFYLPRWEGAASYKGCEAIFSTLSAATNVNGV